MRLITVVQIDHVKQKKASVPGSWAVALPPVSLTAVGLPLGYRVQRLVPCHACQHSKALAKAREAFRGSRRAGELQLGGTVGQSHSLKGGAAHDRLTQNTMAPPNQTWTRKRRKKEKEFGRQSRSERKAKFVIKVIFTEVST